jgi:HlyD family secretion protein
MDIPRQNARRNRIIRRSLYIGVTVIVVGVVTVAVSRLKPAAPSVDRRTLWLDTVKRGPMLRQVRGVGNLVSEDVLVVPAAVAGRVSRIVVEPGTAVDTNTVLLELANPELELEWLDAQSQLSSAKATLAARKATLQDQLLGLEAGLAQAQANYRAAKLRAEVDETQFKEDLISELQLTMSRSSVEESAKVLEITQKRMDMFRDQTMPAQVVELEAALSQAESRYNLKKGQMDSLHVRAGTSGVVAQVRTKIELGEHVSPGTILARITNPERLKAQLKVPETQARDVRIGLPAEVDTYHGVIQGKVSRIDPTAIEGNVTVDVCFDGPLPKGSRPDLSVVGTVEIERLNDVLYVGRPVSVSAEGNVQLFKVVEGGRFATRVRAQLGRSSVSTIEVIDGLATGDEVVLSDVSQWDNCDRIRLR